MHLHWDWRLARVVDAEAVIIDESVWDGVRSSGSVADRIEMVRRNRMTPEARDLSERFPEATPSFTNPNDWPSFSSEEIMLLDQASIILARRGLEESAGDVDRRMEHLVHAVEEMRVGWTTIESRVVEWVGLFLTEINLDEKRRNTVTELPLLLPLKIFFRGSILNLLFIRLPMKNGLLFMGLPPLQSRWQIESKIQKPQSVLMPNLMFLHLVLFSASLAARMTVAAHASRSRLSRLPSSTIQVLGAEKAFFAHLHLGLLLQNMA